MSDFIKTISQLVEKQFPSFYRDDGAGFVAFVKAYYEFLETTDKYSYKENRELFNSNDVDDTLNEFLTHFKEKYLADFPFITATDKRFMIKHIMDYYRTKGSKQSLELLMRLLYNEEVDVYYPSNDILKASDSLWYVPVYIETHKTIRTSGFVNKQILGSRSGASAFVEGIVTKRVDGKLIDVMYLSSVRGDFKTGEYVTDDGDLVNAPRIVGSLTTLDIELGGRNNKVGDLFDVITPQGRHGKVRVTGILNETGKVDFELVDGGYGYTNTTSSSTATATDIYVSDAVIYTNNTDPELDFIRFETVVQRLETLTVISAADIINTATVGDYIHGVSGAEAFVANGHIVSINSTGAADATIIVQIIGDTTFSDQRKINLTLDKNFVVGEYIEEESSITLNITALSGTFVAGEKVTQIVRDPVDNNTILSYAFGTVVTANSEVITIDQAWGNWSSDIDVTGPGVTPATALTTSLTITEQGARGYITSKQTGYITARDIFGLFTNGKKIRGAKTRFIDTVATTENTGAADVWLSGNSLSNGAIDTATNSYAKGIVVGSNTTAVGVYGNTSPFIYDTAGVFKLETIRDELISPPRYANTDIIELNKDILGVATGSSASFKVGFLENTENVTLNTDIVGDQNVAEVPYLDVLISGENTGVGFVDSVSITSGGTGYNVNDTVTFTDGGVGGGDPYEIATGYVSAVNAGVITAITIDVIGSGYYTTPSISVAGGLGAILVVNMDYGYGFPKQPQGAIEALIGDVLNNEDFTIGSIASLTQINPGINYNADPFVVVHNKYIASYERRNFYADLSNITGSFKIGETLTQIIDGSTTAKGKVLEYTRTGDTGTLLIERNAFNIAFQSGINITGDVSGAIAAVDGVIDDPSSSTLGDNAIVTGTIIAANGIATEVEVVDSGYGYVQDGDVVLERDGFEFIITAKSNVAKQGKAEGYWKTTSSHLNSEKKLEDNYYYQEYSYDIISGVSLNRYEDILKKVLHVSGHKMFGSVSKNSVIDSEIKIAQSSIDIL